MQQRALIVQVHRMQRAKGQLVLKTVASLTAQRLRQWKHPHILAQIFDYSSRAGVVLTEGICAPAGAPGYLQRVFPNLRDEYRYITERLWNEAEAAEPRAEAVAATAIVLPIPAYLSPPEMDSLAKLFCRQFLSPLGVAAQYAVHVTPESLPHAHVILTERELNSRGFGRRKLECITKEVAFRVQAQAQYQLCCRVLFAGLGFPDFEIDSRHAPEHRTESQPWRRLTFESALEVLDRYASCKDPQSREAVHSILRSLDERVEASR